MAQKNKPPKNKNNSPIIFLLGLTLNTHIESLIRAFYESFRYSEAADLYRDPEWNIKLKF